MSGFFLRKFGSRFNFLQKYKSTLKPIYELSKINSSFGNFTFIVLFHKK